MKSYDYHRQARIDKAIDKTGGVYPGGTGEDYLHSGLPGVGYIATRWTRITSADFVCTRAEFESRKAERQGKPSWDDAPKWAQWLAQDLSGAWFFYKTKPDVIPGIWFGGSVSHKQEIGEVIGDWHNTLEQRPNQIHPTGDLRRSSGSAGAAAPAGRIGCGSGLVGVNPNYFVESDEKGDFDAAIEAMRDIRTAFAKQAVSQFKASARYVDKHPCGLSKVEVAVEPNIDFEWLANQFDDADDINAVWALRDKLHHKNKPDLSPELSFHLSNAFNELQASARLLPEDDPRRAQIVALAGGVGAVKEVA